MLLSGRALEPQPSPDPRGPDDPSSVRRRALRALPLAAAAPVVGIAALLGANEMLAEQGQSFAGPAVPIFVGSLCVPLLAKLSELVSGVPFRQLAKSWGGLRGWQRAVIGGVAGLAALAMFGAIAFAVSGIP